MPRPGVRGAFLNMLGSVESRRMVNGRTSYHLVIYIMNEVVVYVYYINESLYIMYIHINIYICIYIMCINMNRTLRVLMLKTYGHLFLNNWIG